MSRLPSRRKASKGGRGLPTYSAVAFLVSCLLLAVPQLTLGQCLPGWHFVGSKCFMCYNVHTTLPIARAYCTSIGGTMASLHSSVEDQWVHSNCGGIRVLIGYNTNTKTWEDGSATNYSFNARALNSKDDCVVSRGTNWWKYNCTHTLPSYPATAACSHYPGAAAPTQRPVTLPVTTRETSTASRSSSVSPTTGAATVPQTTAYQSTASPAGSMGATIVPVTLPQTSTQQTKPSPTGSTGATAGPVAGPVQRSQSTAESPTGSTGGTAGPITVPLTSVQPTMASFARSTGATAGPVTLPQTSPQQTAASLTRSTGATAGPVTDSLTSTQHTTEPSTRSTRATAHAGLFIGPLTSTQQTTAAAARCDVAVSARQRATHDSARAKYAIDGLSGTCSVTGHGLKNWLKVELRCRATVSRITLEGTGLDSLHVTVGDGTVERGFRGGADLPANHLCTKDHNPPIGGRKEVTCYAPVPGKYIYISSAAGNTHALSICNLKIN